MPNSKVKFLRGTLVIPSKKKCETNFHSSFSMSSEEYDPFEKIGKNEEQLQMEPLKTDLNTLVLIDKEREDELKLTKSVRFAHSSVQTIGLPDHLKSFVADCRTVFGWSFPAVFESFKVFMVFFCTLSDSCFSVKAEEEIKSQMLVPRLCFRSEVAWSPAFSWCLLFFHFEVFSVHVLSWIWALFWKIH